MSQFSSLKNQFLVAMPGLQDGDFTRSVTLICEHNQEGAMGIVINQPLEISTGDLLEHMEIPFLETHNSNPVLAGGPVQTDRGFVIHRTPKSWKSSISLGQDIVITSSADILHAIAEDVDLKDAFVALGYAGWGPGQLEQEVVNNSWLNAPMQSEILFDTDIEKRWQKTINSLGFDSQQLSYFSGHA